MHTVQWTIHISNTRLIHSKMRATPIFHPGYYKIDCQIHIFWWVPWDPCLKLSLLWLTTTITSPSAYYSQSRSLSESLFLPTSPLGTPGHPPPSPLLGPLQDQGSPIHVPEMWPIYTRAQQALFYPFSSLHLVSPSVVVEFLEVVLMLLPPLACNRPLALGAL